VLDLCLHASGEIIDHALGKGDAENRYLEFEMISRAGRQALGIGLPP
jgi:hypothetical protein